MRSVKRRTSTWGRCDGGRSTPGASSGEDRAREAAEAAISSPLLEDINLAGANGILVNVTAGMDLYTNEHITVLEVGRDA